MARVAALLIVISLLSPALTTIACDAVCALEAAARPMDMATCHEHRADTHGPLLTASSAPCHDGVATLAAVLADSQRWLPTADIPVRRTAPERDRSTARHPSIARSRMPESPPRVSLRI